MPGRWISLLGGLCLGVLVATPVSADETPPVETAAAPLSEQEIRSLIAQLQSPSFEIREQAMQKLAHGGRDVIPSLLQTAEKGSLESAVRAVSVLKTMFETSDVALFDTVLEALETLELDPRQSVAIRARSVLVTREDERVKRTVSRIQQLGGEVQFQSSENQVVFRNGRAVQENSDSIVDTVLLSHEWKGGDEGLKLIRKLGLVRLVYVVHGAKISQPALDELSLAMPGIQIQFRGPAMLGISGQDTPQGMIIGTVQPASAALEAGLEPGDIILRYDGEEMTSFDTLIEKTKSKMPGDMIRVEVLRESGTTIREVILQRFTLPKERG